MEEIIFPMKIVLIMVAYYVMVSRKISKTTIIALFATALIASLDRGAMSLPVAIVFTTTVGGFVKLANKDEK